MLDIDHLSYSSISKYLACPASWKYKYIDNLPTKSSPALVFGSAFHNTVEAYICDRDNIELQAQWMKEWNIQVERNEDCDWGLDTPEKFYNDGLRMLANSDVLKLINELMPKNVERKVTLHLPGVDVPIIGFIDIITEDGIPGDFKTSGKSWSNSRAVNELQPLFYLAALNQAGVRVPDWRFRHYIFVKTKTPKVQKIETVYTLNDIMFMIKVVGSVVDAMIKGAYPENPTTWLCSAKYCDFWSSCRGKS